MLCRDEKPQVTSRLLFRRENYCDADTSKVDSGRRQAFDMTCVIGILNMEMCRSRFFAVKFNPKTRIISKTSNELGTWARSKV